MRKGVWKDELREFAKYKQTATTSVSQAVVMRQSSKFYTVLICAHCDAAFWQITLKSCYYYPPRLSPIRAKCGALFHAHFKPISIHVTYYLEYIFLARQWWKERTRLWRTARWKGCIGQKDREIMCYTFYGWRGGAMARRLTYDEKVASSIPDQGAAA